MNIVWFSWKDRSHPLAGGAETVSGEIMDRLVRDGHSVKHITALYPGARQEETVKGVDIVRIGNRYGVYPKARKFFKHNLSDWPDLVIDEMNTIPFASGFYSKQKNVLLSYQLARKVWFYQMVFPLSLIGYILEPVYLRLIARRYPIVLTESESTKEDMARYGFKKSRIQVFQVGMALQSLPSLPAKTSHNIILSLGAIRPMKRTLHAVKAFEAARDINSNLQMIIAGDTSSGYARKTLRYVGNSRHAAAITVRGRVSNEERLTLMREASVLLVTSVKEGWGLIVTEANSQGTPAIAYDTDGLRDSIRDGQSGLLVADANFTGMGRAIVDLLSDTGRYEDIRNKAWEWSKGFTFESSYQDFLRAISINHPE